MKFKVGDRVLMENILNKSPKNAYDRIQYVEVTILNVYEKTYRVEGINSRGDRIVKPYVCETKLRPIES